MSRSFKRIDAVCLTQLLRSALGHGVNLATYRFLREDEDYAVVAATLTHPPQQIVIKLAGPHAALAPAFERSAAIARLVCARSAVPTFEVIAVDGSFRLWPWQYLVTTFLPGQQWSETHARKSNREVHILHASLGTTIGQLHTIGFSSCGEIAPDGNVVAGTTYYAALMERAQRRIANPAHVALFLSVLQEHRPLFEDLATGTLCHEDLNPSNLLVREPTADQPVVAVIDFESAWAGCAESDLARLEFWRGMMGDGFWEAYRVHASLSDSYPERRPIYQLLWCLEYARSTVQHFRDTAFVCEALHIPPVIFS